MRYVPLGRSGLMVSAVCLGGNSWGAAGRRAWAPFDKEASRPFFRCALDLGINFFDTADAYNEGESEAILGECLLSYAKRDEVVICTKVGHNWRKGANSGGLGRKHILDSIDAQLARLRTDYIDLYLLHVPDATTPVEETMDALTTIVRAGKVRFVGASNQPAWRFAQMLALAEHKGYARMVAMQGLYNLIQREQETEMNPLCRDQGVALTPYSPNARGILAGNRKRNTERAAKDQFAQKLELREGDLQVLDAAEAIARERGITMSQVALAWLWAKGVTSPVIGTTRLEYIDDAAKAVDQRLSAEECARLQSPYRFRPVAPA